MCVCLSNYGTSRNGSAGTLVEHVDIMSWYFLVNFRDSKTSTKQKEVEKSTRVTVVSIFREDSALVLVQRSLSSKRSLLACMRFQLSRTLLFCKKYIIIIQRRLMMNTNINMLYNLHAGASAASRVFFIGGILCKFF